MHKTMEAFDGLPIPRRYYSGGVIWLVIFIATLDNAVANVALPIIRRSLHASAGASVWVVNSYQLTIAMLLLMLAAVGDRLGHRRVYLAGLVTFTVGSLACALSNTLPALIAARVLQGIGAAGVLCLNVAMVRATYPSAMLGRAIGYNALVLSISAAMGPTLAAAILSLANWQWLFLINVPICVAAIVFGARLLPNTPGHGLPVDYFSALLTAMAMGGVIGGAEGLARGNFAFAAPSLAAGLAAAAYLTIREISRPAPLVPFDLLRNPTFSLAIATSLVSFAAQAIAFVSIPFLLQTMLHKSVIASGVLMTAWPIGVALIVTVSGRLSDRRRPAVIATCGLPVFAMGLWSLSYVTTASSAFDIALRMALGGLGFGLFQAPNNRMIIGSAPQARSGAAGGMLATARLTGQSLGAVVVSATFHLYGVGAAPDLLRCAAVAAVVAAGVSATRLNV